MARSTRTRKARPASTRPARAKARTRALRKPALSRPSRRAAGRAQAPEREVVNALDFEAGDERSGRAGDRKRFTAQRDEYPPARVREAGRTAGETAHPERNTADDAAPDTLLDDEGGQNPADQRGPRAADTALSVVDISAIGAGGGRDEAEAAQVDPIDPAEHRRLRQRVARSGTSLLEPNESRAGSPGRGRNRRR
jgi:hypothetical protein